MIVYTHYYSRISTSRKLLFLLLTQGIVMIMIIIFGTRLPDEGEN